MEKLKESIKKIKAIILDVDGVLTDGSLFYGKDGEHIKRFNAKDGQGIKLAQNYNIEFAVISGRKCDIVQNRMTELGVKHIHQGIHDKPAKVKSFASFLGVELDEIAFIGDDILDVPAMEIVGLPFAPKDAHPTALSKAKIVTELPGGHGCVREMIDLILNEQGKITF